MVSDIKRRWSGRWENNAEIMQILRPHARYERDMSARSSEMEAQEQEHAGFQIQIHECMDAEGGTH